MRWQVMWELNTLDGSRLLAILVPTPPPDPSSRPFLPSCGSWRLEVESERPPFAHVIAAAAVDIPEGGCAGPGPGRCGWVHVMLSLRHDRPTLLHVAAPVSRSGDAAWQAEAGCWYGPAVKGHFLHGCEGVTEDGGGAVWVAGAGAERKGAERCRLVHGELQAAAKACGRRGTCGGVTLVPGWGYELRASGSLGEWMGAGRGGGGVAEDSGWALGGVGGGLR